MRNIESRIERAERLVGEEHRPYDGDDSPQFVRVRYDPNFFGNKNKLPDAVREQMDAWPDEEIVEVR